MPVTAQQVFDHSGKPISEGVYDNRLGPTEHDQICPICGQHPWNCPGHFGNIKLAMPVYHPLYVKQLSRFLGGFCTGCSGFRIPQQIVTNVTNALKLISRGQVINVNDVFTNDDEPENVTAERQKEINELIRKLPIIEPNSYIVQTRELIIKEFLTRASSYRIKCANCGCDNRKVKFDNFHFEFILTNSDKKVAPEFISITEIREKLNDFYAKNQGFFDEFFNQSGPDFFFVDTVCVTPPKFRPMSVLGDKINSHPTSSGYIEIIKANNFLTDLIQKEDAKSIRPAHNRLQQFVNTFMDSALSKTPKKTPNGIRQTLEKKDGLFRKNLMGKRVNFSARSVIAPDPYVATDEVGVPEIFAKTLSYPERVTEFNKERLSQAIINGTDKYPGANFVIDPNGQTFQLKGMKEGRRQAIAAQIFAEPDGDMPWTVGRHAINGDYVLINRQPTLHRVSILAMRTKVLPNQRTIRMHYSNCSSFNADFDGDEINLHLPQSEIARAEANVLSLSSRHYITPTAGNPIRGLIQDHVDAGALLTIKNRFFSQATYQQLVFTAFGDELNKKIEMLPPAIIYPKKLWTGKQVISTIIINITKGISDKMMELTSNSKITNVLCHGSPEETVVRFVDGQLVTGIIDKNQFGASKYGMVHTIYELYGSDMASRFLTMLTRLFTFFMQMHGFSCGIADMGISRAGEQMRERMRENTKKVADEVAEKFVDEFGAEEDKGLPLKNRLWKLIRNADMKERFDHMTMDKLNNASTTAINGVFPAELTKPFPMNHMIMMTTSGAKGSIVNSTQISCLLGQQSLEGKRVPLMRSGKALPSFEFMELAPEAGGFVSSRFLTGLTPQEYYYHAMGGREGLTDTAVKTANTGYLQRCIIKNIEGLHAAYDGTVRDADNTIIQFLYGEDGIDPLCNKYITKFDFMLNNLDSYSEKLNIASVSDKADCSLIDRIIEEKPLEDENIVLTNKYPPHRHVGAISQAFENQLNSYCKKIRDQGVDDETIKKLRTVATFNYFASLVHPGEVVGVIAAEAIGEPATQMTLNTFHLAGYGGTNVTLGIPRLREILIVATRTPATPMMFLPMKDGKEESAKEFLQYFKRVPMKDIVESYQVHEHLTQKTDTRMYRVIDITLKLVDDAFPDYDKAKKDETALKIEQIRTRFAQLLKRRINAVFKNSADKITDIQSDEQTKGIKGTLKEEEMGADLNKAQSRKEEQKSYEAEEHEKEDADDDDDEDEKKTENKGDDSDVEEKDDTVVSEFNLENRTLHVSFSINNVGIKILFESIIDGVLQDVMVHEVKNVKRATVDKSAKGIPQVVTEGANFKEIVNCLEIDMNHFYTNDIGIILKRYGIEAARNAIIKEVNSVFQNYCIDVDKRHLQLIADFVTNSGEWLGLSRHSMKKCASPFQQMSFETTTQFLKHVTMHGGSDMMETPSASLTTGNVIKMGSGLCEILVPFE
jgi:DNA-directed RNA polymerase I subunit RPA1